MSLIQWNDTLSVGIGEIDKQHIKLIGLINQLNDAIQSGHDQEALAGVLDELVAYTMYHFGTEERLMELYAYTELAPHIERHEQFLIDITTFIERYQERSSPQLAKDLITFLSDWLSNHILRTDKELASFLTQHGYED